MRFLFEASTKLYRSSVRVLYISPRYLEGRVSTRPRNPHPLCIAGRIHQPTMTAIQSPEAVEHGPSGANGVKRSFPTMDRYPFSPDTNFDAARRNSTILNPRSYVAEELSKRAPVFTGSTKFDPLEDAKNILVTGGAGFMYVSSAADTLNAARQITATTHATWIANATQRLLVCTAPRTHLPPLQRRLAGQARLLRNAEQHAHARRPTELHLRAWRHHLPKRCQARAA